MPAFEVQTAQITYPSVVERGILRRIRDFVPASSGRLFAVTTADVWGLYGPVLQSQFDSLPMTTLLFPGGESNKRLARLEELADQMLAAGGDRSSLIIGFGGGIVTDVAGFLAAVFMRGVPVLQVPTTLLAQVDAAVDEDWCQSRRWQESAGKLSSACPVLIDPEVLNTLPPREFRAGLFEIVKCGIIRDRALFDCLEASPDRVLALQPKLLDELISAAVRIKAEVVSADERESDLRRILNFGHTIGHAIEAETGYVRFLHGEAVAWGMLAATRLAELLQLLSGTEGDRIRSLICCLGPLPSAHDLSPDRLLGRLGSDKKTLQGRVHFVLPTSIGTVRIESGIDSAVIRQAIVESLA